MSNSNLMNHVLMNKLDDELSKAINEVGGDTSSAKGPWDYPAIIKEQLEAKGAAAELKAGPGIIIRDFQGQKFICGTSGALTTGALNPPSGSYKQPVSEVIEAGTPVQEVFEALFYKILPRMSSVYKGDIVRSDKDGSDRYNEEDTRTGLIPNSVYLRLYVANRQEPVYILLSGHGIVNSEGNIGVGGEAYVGSKSEYIDVEVNGNVITATLNDNGVEFFKKISVLESNLVEVNNLISQLDTKVTVTESSLNASLEAINKNIVDIELNIASLNSSLDGKANVAEVNTLKSSINAVSSTVNNLSSKLSSLEVKMDAKADVTELNAIKSSINSLSSSFNNLSSSMTDIQSELTNVKTELESKVNESDIEGIESKVDSMDSKVATMNTKVSSMENSLATKADVGVVESLMTEVGEVKSDLSSKASTQSVTEIQQTVTEVQQTVTEVQQTAVTQEQVNTIVEQEVSNVVNNTEIVDSKVKEQIIEALNSEEDNEIKAAVEGVVSDMMAENATSDTSGMVDDLFSGL